MAERAPPRDNGKGDGTNTTPSKQSKRKHDSNDPPPSQKRTRADGDEGGEEDVAMGAEARIEAAREGTSKRKEPPHDEEDPPIKGGVDVDALDGSPSAPSSDDEEGAGHEDLNVELSNMEQYLTFIGVYLKRKHKGLYDDLSNEGAITAYYENLSKGGGTGGDDLASMFGLPKDVAVFSTGFGLGLLSPSESDGNAGAPGNPYRGRYTKASIARAEQAGHFIQAEGTGGVYPCTLAAGFNVGAHLGLGVDLGSGFPPEMMKALENIALEIGRHPYGKKDVAPAQDMTYVDLSRPVLEERPTVKPQCGANPIRHSGRTGDDTMGPGFPNSNIVQSAYQRFAGDMGFKVVGPPAIHSAGVVTGMLRQPDPAKLDSVYSGAKFGSDQQTLYGGTGCLYSPLVMRADSCSAGTSAFCLGIQNSLFPRAVNDNEGLERVHKAMRDAHNPEKRRNMSELIEQFRAAGCYCAPDSDADLAVALEVRNFILFFGYYMYTVQTMYSEEVLGRIKEQKRSEHNCEHYRRATEGCSANRITLEELRNCKEDTFWDILNECGPPKDEKERQKYAQAITVDKRVPGDGLGPTENYDQHWVRNSGTGYTVRYGKGPPVLHDCSSSTLYFQLCCQIREPISSGLAPIRAPGNLGTTAANIAHGWFLFLDQADATTQTDAEAQRALAVLKSERICHLVVTRALESLLVASRVEMELRVRDLACPIYLGAVADKAAPQKHLADERLTVMLLLYQQIKGTDMGALPTDLEALRWACDEALASLEIMGYYQPEFMLGSKGKISGCDYLCELRPGFDAGIQSFRKHLLVLAQAAARHGEGVSASAHRTLYSLCHYSLTSRTCPINDMSLDNSHAMCGRMSRYVGPSFHHSMYDTAVSLQGGSFELVKVLEIRLAGGTANLMLCRFAAAISASDPSAPYRWVSHACSTGEKARQVLHGLLGTIQPGLSCGWHLWSAEWSFQQVLHGAGPWAWRASCRYGGGGCCIARQRRISVRANVPFARSKTHREGQHVLWRKTPVQGGWPDCRSIAGQGCHDTSERLWALWQPEHNSRGDGLQCWRLGIWHGSGDCKGLGQHKHAGLRKGVSKLRGTIQRAWKPGQVQACARGGPCHRSHVCKDEERRAAVMHRRLVWLRWAKWGSCEAAPGQAQRGIWEQHPGRAHSSRWHFVGRIAKERDGIRVWQRFPWWPGACTYTHGCKNGPSVIRHPHPPLLKETEKPAQVYDLTAVKWKKNGFHPYFEGLKPSPFMVLGSKGLHYPEIWRIDTQKFDLRNMYISGFKHNYCWYLC